jgi:cytochrome c-type biogenesis protein CcmE
MQNRTVAKIGLTAAVALGGVGFLLYSSSEAAQHYEMVDHLLEKGLENFKDKQLKVHGFVKAGSIVESVINQEYHRTFVLQKGGKAIRVFSIGPTPDTFKDQSEVVASGRLLPAADMQKLADDICAKPRAPTDECPIKTGTEQAWVVESTELMAKCPSKYEGATSNKIDTNFK